jgi:hypothetical protein
MTVFVIHWDSLSPAIFAVFIFWFVVLLAWYDAKKEPH